MHLRVADNFAAHAKRRIPGTPCMPFANCRTALTSLLRVFLWLMECALEYACLSPSTRRKKYALTFVHHMSLPGTVKPRYRRAATQCASGSGYVVHSAMSSGWPFSCRSFHEPHFRCAKANVMLEYEYAEAAKLLATNLKQVCIWSQIVLGREHIVGVHVTAWGLLWMEDGEVGNLTTVIR